MKAIVTLVVLYGIVQAHALSYNSEFDECVTELQLNSEEIHRLHKGDFLPEDHHDYTQFMECFWRKIGFLYANGEANYDEIRKMYFEIIRRQYDAGTSIQKANEIVSQCESIRGESPGLTAIKVGNCLKQSGRQNRNEHRY